MEIKHLTATESTVSRTEDSLGMRDSGGFMMAVEDLSTLWVFAIADKDHVALFDILEKMREIIDLSVMVEDIDLKYDIKEWVTVLKRLCSLSDIMMKRSAK